MGKTTQSRWQIREPDQSPHQELLRVREPEHGVVVLHVVPGEELVDRRHVAVVMDVGNGAPPAPQSEELPATRHFRQRLRLLSGPAPTNYPNFQFMNP